MVHDNPVQETQICGGRIGDFQGLLYPGEEAQIHRAVDKRKHEFRAGRCCAREAISRLGGSVSEIGTGTFREPIWPSGITGSITHSDTHCFAIVGRSMDHQGLGIDIEAFGRLHRDLWHLIFSASELARLTHSVDTMFASTVTFSAKESVLKALCAATGVVAALPEIEIDVHADGRFSARLPPPQQATLPVLQGFWRSDAIHVLTLLRIPPVPSPILHP